MKKLLLLATLLAAFASFGCGSDETPAAPAKAPELPRHRRLNRKFNITKKVKEFINLPVNIKLPVAVASYINSEKTNNEKDCFKKYKPLLNRC